MLLLLTLACAHHIENPGPLSLAADPPSDASELKVCWVEFARGSLPHGMVVAHGALKEDVESTQSGLLLIHPKGTWLVDGGMVMDLAPELKEVHGLPRVFLGQASAGWTRTASPADAVKAVGVDPASLTGTIATHGHFDHLGGLLELPNVPVYLPQAEIDLAKEVTDGKGTTILPAEARGVLPRAKPIAFDGGPALLWDESHDLFGDGSVILVPMPGHTPGSVGVWVRRPGEKSVLAVGDTVWVREGYEKREPKSWLAGNFDSDQAGIDLQIARLAALHVADPGVVILPAHDRRVWVDTFGQPGCD